MRVVRRHGDISGLILAPRLRYNPLHFDDAVLRIDDSMTAGSSRGQIDEITEDAIAESVMSDLAYALMLIGGHSDDVKDQRFFCLSSITPFKADSSPTP